MSQDKNPDREAARKLMSHRQLAVSVLFKLDDGTSVESAYDGTADVAIPPRARSFTLWAHALDRARTHSPTTERASPVEGPIATLREQGIDALAVHVLQRADLRLG